MDSYERIRFKKINFLISLKLLDKFVSIQIFYNMEKISSRNCKSINEKYSFKNLTIIINLFLLSYVIIE